jgi:hypothetical protein
MMDYTIQPNSRRCCITGRDLKPGERYYSALLEEAGRFVRKDFALDAWQGPPEGAFSYWTGKVHADQGPVKPRFDDDLLEECFHRLDGQLEPSKVNFRYVVALLLIRRKRFRFEQTLIEAGEEKMVLTAARSGEKYMVTNPRLTDEAMMQVQEEVFNVLGWN